MKDFDIVVAVKATSIARNMKDFNITKATSMVYDTKDFNITKATSIARSAIDLIA